MAETGLDYDTLKASAWVARKVEMVRRRTISFSHHREVAPLPPDAQESLLASAASGEVESEGPRLTVALALPESKEEEERGC